MVEKEKQYAVLEDLLSVYESTRKLILEEQENLSEVLPPLTHAEKTSFLKGQLFIIDEFIRVTQQLMNERKETEKEEEKECN